MFQMFEDRPDNYDAWNLEQYYSGTCGAGQPCRAERGKQRRALLYYDKARVFHPCGAAHRRSIRTPAHRLYHPWTGTRSTRCSRAAFPDGRICCTRARYDISSAALSGTPTTNVAQIRPTSLEAGYGVGFSLNDCKYGCDTSDDVMRLSLLRSPTHLTNADHDCACVHAYALLPEGRLHRTRRRGAQGLPRAELPAYAR